MDEIQSFKPFEESIRKHWDKNTNKWWFAIVDVIDLLAEPSRVREYWRKMKVRDFAEVSPFWCQFKLEHKSNGRMYDTDCADMQGILRIIQSISSPKAEPFKQWLATVGQDRIEETTDPSKALDRIAELYKGWGYSDRWIALRLKNITVRNTLIAEWNNRDVTDDQIIELLNVISTETFEMDVEEYRQFKGLTKEKLEDHMTDVELAVSTLSEVSAAHIASATNAQGYDANKEVAKKGGRIGRNARLEIDSQSLGRNVISEVNYLSEPEKEVREKLLKPVNGTNE